MTQQIWPKSKEIKELSTTATWTNNTSHKRLNQHQSLFTVRFGKLNKKLNNKGKQLQEKK